MVGRGFLCAVALSFVAFVCSHPLRAQPVEGNLGRSQDPLVVGTPVDDEAERQNLGLLTLSTGCSASLLQNSWAVTASHCFSYANVQTPNTVTLRARWGTPEQVQSPDRIYRFWGADPVRPGLIWDVALIHLPTPFTVNGSDRGYARQIDSRNLPDMLNETVQVYGRGISRLAFTDVNGVDQPSLGDDLFRKGEFKVSVTDTTGFWYPRNATGQIVAGGDSGGPTYVRGADGAMRLAGVHALCDTLQCLPTQTCTDATGKWVSWMWTSSIGRCGDAPVGGRIAWAIQDIMNQFWDPNRPVASLAVHDSESYIGPDLWLDNLDGRNWAQVQRTAYRLCTNRGFAAGFATGRSDPGPAQAPAQPDGRYDLVCLNQTAGQWFDATPAQLTASGEAFTDINAVGWAQAGRAADNLCRAMSPGSPGGRLTGFTAKAPGDPNQRTGVFCLNGTGGQWSDALAPDLSATGESIGDLNGTNWASAARAADGWCIGQGWPNGGFLNGQQLDQKRGTVCVGPRTSDPSNHFDTSVVAYAPTTLYAIANNNDLLWYQNANASRPGGSHDWLGPKKVGNGWGGFKDVFSDGGGAIYALQNDGTLRWYGHDGYFDGTQAWHDPTTVGNGWAGFKQIVPAGEYVMYGIQPDGTLLWYRHNGAPSGVFDWTGPKPVGNGWQNFKSVFSGGGGVLYAIQTDGKLLRYVHKDYLTGGSAWDGPKEIGSGWQGFKQVFAGPDGVIYGLQPDGKLIWYRYGKPHPAPPTPPVPAGSVRERIDETRILTSAGGSNRVIRDTRSDISGLFGDMLRWEGPVEVSAGWDTFKKVFPVMATPPSVVR